MKLAYLGYFARVQFARCAAIALTCVAIEAFATPALASPPEEPDDESLPARLPGLVAVYLQPAQGIEFSRYESLPAFALRAGESPDPRLPPTGWTVRYRGVIEIQRPGKYRFALTGSGRAELSIAGQPIALSPAGGANVPAGGEGVELSLGLHPLELRYTPQPTEPAELRIFWQSENFDEEPLPSSALGHAETEPVVNDLFVRGRLMVEEHSCASCHRANGGAPLSEALASRPAPRLTSAGSRLKPEWVFHWLDDPSALRPEALMPRLFSPDERGAVERYAVATFLARESGPLASAADPPADVLAQSIAEGEQLFTRIGCAICHEPQAGEPARVTLRGLGEKTTPEALEAFLHKPAAVAPAGRMPGFALTRLAGRQLALYLIFHDRATVRRLELPPAPTRDAVLATFAALPTSEAERSGFASLIAEDQLAELGRHVVRSKNCVACHEFQPAADREPWQVRASRFDFAAIAARPSGACLGAPDDPRAGQSSPRFGPALDREAAAAFLKAATGAPATPAPGDAARLALARLNCLGCHQRDGQGGLTPEFINRLGKGEDATAELVTPPTLTQVTAKLTTAALRGVLERDERARPWMSLQMPRFEREHMGELVEQLAALDAQPRTDALQESPPSAAAAGADDDEAPVSPLAEAGRTLVGSRGFGCTKCHDMLGIPSSGTRGPDLANVTARVNQSWYVRWMKDPLRIQQGTRMPTVFLERKSPYKDVLDGDPARQREAIWQYMAAARSLPPPEGLEEKKLETLAAGTQPVAVRTFLPGTTPRGIAIRFPNKVHAAFDAQTCRLAYLWSGEFLDMAPVWNGRGGHEAHLLGSIFWTAPAGCPWDVTAADAGRRALQVAAKIRRLARLCVTDDCIPRGFRSPATRSTSAPRRSDIGCCSATSSPRHSSSGLPRCALTRA
jgi:mono/diheme cytochrome c family protein